MRAHLSLIGSIVEIDALCHDFGKGTMGFRERLERAVSGDERAREALRHELISALLLADAMSLADYDWRAMGETGHLRSVLAEAAAGLRTRYRDPLSAWIDAADDARGHNALLSQRLHGFLGEPQWREQPVACAITWLALTHHSLTKGCALAPARGRRRSHGARIACDLSDYILPEASLGLDKSLTFAAAMQPWDNAAWLAEAAAAFAGLDATLQATGGIAAVEADTPHWLTDSLYALARPVLIWSDYLGSADKSAYAGDEQDRQVFANTVRARCGVRMGDPLALHLRRVAGHVRTVFPGLVGRGQGLRRALPSLVREARPVALARGSARRGSPFAWQEQAYRALGRWRDTPGGAFVAIVAGTGSGKTVACARFAHQLSARLRLSVGLGLRTLTTQTHRKWTRAPIGFAPNEVALLVGAPSGVETEGTDGADGADGVGNRAEAAMSRSVIEGAHKAPDCVLAHMIGRAQERAVIASPVQVMTIDHLVRVATMARGGDTRLLWHVMSSDLILDEIDDYAPGDLVALGQLVRLYGFYGRKVFIASATLSPVIFDALYRAWLSGYRHHRQFHPGANAPRVAMISDRAPYARLMSGSEPGRISRAWRGFVARHARAEGRPRRRLGLLALRTDDGQPRWGDLWRGILRLHRTPANHCRDRASGVRLSAGFVRLNRVDDTQRLARWLAQQADAPDTALKLVCYHGRHTLLVRDQQERLLDALMARGGAKDPLVTHPVVRQALNEAQAQGAKDLIIVVCTTSLIETGRDHDYDWAVLEPSSTRALVQACGRVWRHRRTKRARKPNVLVLEHPLNALRGGALPWSYPGIETPQSPQLPPPYRVLDQQGGDVAARLRALSIETCEPSGVRRAVTLAREALPRRLFTEGVSAAPCLLPPRRYSDAPLSALECLATADTLAHPAAGQRPDLAASLNILWTRSDATLTRFLCQHHRWRDGTGDEVEVHAMSLGDPSHGQRWRLRTPDGAADIDVRPADEGEATRWLIQPDPASRAPGIARRLGLAPDSPAFCRQALGIHLRPNLIRRPQLSFGHQIGFCAQS